MTYEELNQCLREEVNQCLRSLAHDKSQSADEITDQLETLQDVIAELIKEVNADYG